MDKALELIKQLSQSDDYFERQKAAWALVKIGDSSVDVVAEALEKGEFSDLRYKSAWILGKIGCPRAVEPLSRALLSDPDHVVREWCAAALEAVGSQEGAPALVLAMKRDSSKDVRLRAAVALRNLKASKALQELLSYSDPEIRGLAVTGLAKIGHRDCLNEVARLLQDEDAEVRRRSAAYMAEFACDEALKSLERALQDSEPMVQIEALKALGRIKGEKACDVALRALQDEDSQVRYTAVTALGEIGQCKAVDTLVEIMFGQDEEEIRAWAAWSLGEIGDVRAVEHLRKAYRTCPMEVMKKAKDSLVEVFKVEL